MSTRPAKRMVALGDLISSTPGAHLAGGRAPANAATLISGIELDSRDVELGDIFAALPGRNTHGARHGAQAMANGAAAILTDEQGLALLDSTSITVPVVVVPNPRDSLGDLSSLIYGNPEITLLGITGTNGKTTVASMLEAGLRAAGRSTGVIGTLGTRIGDQVIPTSRTTPEAVHVHALLAAMRERGVDAVAMEVSSIALCEGRVDGLRFAVAGFTNLSQDHLDYHGSMDAYFAAKAGLFTPERSDHAVIGLDSEWGRRLAASVGIPSQTWTTLPDQAADWRLHADAGRWTVSGPDGERQELEPTLPGAFNRANALCAYVMLRTIGIQRGDAARGIESAVVPGRMEIVASVGGVVGIVDYAHTPDAIERVIAATRDSFPGRVIVVLGAGGDRDRAKRPLMGRAARLADAVIVTDDNPRSEDPASIRQAVSDGVGEAAARIIPERRAAIAEAVASAGAGDVVLLLGKGHEQGQEIAGVVHPFDDRAELRRALEGDR